MCEESRDNSNDNMVTVFKQQQRPGQTDRHRDNSNDNMVTVFKQQQRPGQTHDVTHACYDMPLNATTTTIQ